MKLVFNKAKKPLGVLLLTVFVFIFLHSELGFLNCNNHDHSHSSHDYCSIVDGSTVPSNERKPTELNKLKVFLNFCGGTGSLEDQKTLTFSSDEHSLRYLLKTDKLFLHYSSFLI